MIIRSLSSPSVYSFSHFGSSTRGLPEHQVLCTPTHAHITPSSSTSPLIFRGSELISDLVSLTNRIYSSLASHLILGRLAPSIFFGFTHKSRPVNPRLSDTRLSPSIPGSQCHVSGGDSALPRRSEKISHGNKIYRSPLHCESISGQT